MVEALRQTLDDERLSRTEARALKVFAADLADDPADLAFLRNRAFELAADRVRAARRRSWRG